MNVTNINIPLSYFYAIPPVIYRAVGSFISLEAHQSAGVMLFLEDLKVMRERKLVLTGSQSSMELHQSRFRASTDKVSLGLSRKGILGTQTTGVQAVKPLNKTSK